MAPPAPLAARPWSGGRAMAAPPEPGHSSSFLSKHIERAVVGRTPVALVAPPRGPSPAHLSGRTMAALKLSLPFPFPFFPLASHRARTKVRPWRPWREMVAPPSVPTPARVLALG